MKNLIAEFNRQTNNIRGDETFVFAFDNPKLDDVGVITIGDENEQARLLAGTVDGLSKDVKELALSYMVTDDPETFVAVALSYIAEIEKKQGKKK